MGEVQPQLASQDLANAIVRAAADRKAQEIVTLDLRGLSDVTDYFVVMSAATARQADAIIDRITELVRDEAGERPLSVEGRAGLRWVLMDYGTVVVHVFLPEVREYYRLERLWGDAPRVSFGVEGELESELMSS